MGWGEARTPSDHQIAAAAAQRLADAVRAWNHVRTTGNEERMVERLADYDRAAARVA